MKLQLIVCAAIVMAMAAELPASSGGTDDKAHTVGKDDLVLQGEVAPTDVKVKVFAANKFAMLPAKRFAVQLSAGKKYRVSLDSKEIDSVLVVQDKTGKQLAWDDDSGGGLNSLLTLDVVKDDTYKIYAASLKGAGGFTLKVKEDGAVKIHEVGAGLKLTGELGRTQAITYNVNLAARKTYVIDMIGLNRQTLDPYLRLLDAEGKQLAEDDDGGEGLNARIMHKVESAGIYQVVATCFENGRGLFALTIREAEKGEEQKRTQVAIASQLDKKAAALYRSGQYREAIEFAQEALKIRKEVPGAKGADYALSLDNLAALYSAHGDVSKAEPLYLTALNIRKEVLGEKNHNYATSLNNMAWLYDAQGNHAKAEMLFRQVLAIHKEVSGEKNASYAASLTNLAGSYASQGNYSTAEPLYRQALEIRMGVLGEKHPDHAQSLTNLASLYTAQQNFAKAEPLLRKALEIHKEVLGETHPAYVTGLNNLASVYEAQGKNDNKAEPLLRQALEIRKKTLGEKHPDYAQSLNNLALLYDVQGKPANAQPLYRQALNALVLNEDPVPIEDLTPDDLRIHPDTVVVLANHALLMEAAAAKDPTPRNLRSCAQSFLLALTVLDRVRQENLDHQESKIQLTAEAFYLFPRRIKVLQQLFRLEQRTQDLEAAFGTAEQGTARAFLEALGKNRANLLAGVAPSLQTEEIQMLQDLRFLDLRLARESAQALDKRDPDLIGKLLIQRRDAQKKLREVISRMENVHPQYAGLKYPRPCLLDQARACLSPEEVALLFVPGTKESFIVVVDSRPKPEDKDNGLAIFEIAGAEVLVGYLNSLTDLGTLALPARIKALGREAFDVILGLCKERIKDRNLVIVPGGSLCYLPFELLVDEDGRYLLEKHRIRYAPSLTSLHLINLWKQKRADPKVPLFAVGDPLYDVETKLVAASGHDGLHDLPWRESKPEAFQRLVHSGKEVAQIAKLLGAEAEFVLTAKNANEANVKAASASEQLAKARYVHFATHGILGVDKNKQPALVLNLVGNSGKDGDDGFLEYEEILNLKLNADLVVLSACRTGQGRMARGEGVTGLARAFLYAGSKGVVCSLWSVDDRATVNLMVDFYGHLQKGRPAAEALREAQLRMIREGNAPLYWAPFIVIGE